jgi:hypothetical protein
MLLRVAFVKFDLSEEHSASIIRVIEIGEVGTTLAPFLDTLMMKALRSFETSVLTRATQCNIPGDGIIHSHCRETLKSYVV